MPSASGNSFPFSQNLARSGLKCQFLRQLRFYPLSSVAKPPQRIIAARMRWSSLGNSWSI